MIQNILFYFESMLKTNLVLSEIKINSYIVSPIFPNNTEFCFIKTMDNDTKYDQMVNCGLNTLTTF